jgi:3-dehydroquinate synthetase
MGAKPDILFAFGGAELWKEAEEALGGRDDIHFAVMPSTLVGALRFPPRGARLPDSFFSDANLYDEEDEEARRKAVIYGIRLGLAFDRWIFDTMYSTFDPSFIVKRSVGIWHDIAEAEKNGSDARLLLGCGGFMAGVARRIVGEELTDGEALAIGLVMEAGLALRVGVAREKYFDDLVGMLNYWGYPLGMDVDTDTLRTAILGVSHPDDEVTFYLAKNRGHCVPYTITYEKLIALLG